ncbi:hypothetical protein SEMRO_2978_G341430.1 [Seminavis robusta]|uniref:Uncharacterized protein n=1 Tax=Seminavis robusta TaxID=568900 RepID=A0A9N8F346_9STRA|nr:hypothetical protein SEMRO_2978_G341430.1 [Seminavis robusta]|eukprot:Sro2978_g341430.1 n/a (369) ;mRNA; r:8011-9117
MRNDTTRHTGPGQRPQPPSESGAPPKGRGTCGHTAPHKRPAGLHQAHTQARSVDGTDNRDNTPPTQETNEGQTPKATHDGANSPGTLGSRAQERSRRDCGQGTRGQAATIVTATQHPNHRPNHNERNQTNRKRQERKQTGRDTQTGRVPGRRRRGREEVREANQRHKKKEEPNPRQAPNPQRRSTEPGDRNKAGKTNSETRRKRQKDTRINQVKTHQRGEGEQQAGRPSEDRHGETAKKGDTKKSGARGEDTPRTPHRKRNSKKGYSLQRSPHAYPTQATRQGQETNHRDHDTRREEEIYAGRTPTTARAHSTRAAQAHRTGASRARGTQKKRNPGQNARNKHNGWPQEAKHENANESRPHHAPPVRT